MYEKEPDMTAKMTEAEFRAAVHETLTHRHSILQDVSGLIAKYAERAGVEWLPEPVEPVVGELLTLRTRLVKDLVVVTLGGVAWQHDGHVWLCVGDTWSRTTTEAARQGARIVYVPGGES